MPNNLTFFPSRCNCRIRTRIEVVIHCLVVTYYLVYSMLSTKTLDYLGNPISRCSWCGIRSYGIKSFFYDKEKLYGLTMVDLTKKTSPQTYNADLCGLDTETLKKIISYHLISFQSRDPERVGNRDLYRALAYTLRDTLIKNWIKTQKSYYAKKRKRVYYLSLEFLIGCTLGNTLINLGYHANVSKVVKDLGYDLEEVREEEEDTALETVVWGDWQPVLWTPWQLWEFRHTAMASAMNMAFFIRN